MHGELLIEWLATGRDEGELCQSGRCAIGEGCYLGLVGGDERGCDDGFRRGVKDDVSGSGCCGRGGVNGNADLAVS